MNDQFNVIGFSETWLKHSNTLLQTPDYSFICKNRCEKGDGGAAMYIQNTFVYFHRNDLVPNDTLCDSLFIKLIKYMTKTL